MSLQGHSPSSKLQNNQNWSKTIKNLNIEDSKFIVFLKYSTFQNKSSQPCSLTPLDSIQLLRLNKIMNLIYKKYIEKQLSLKQLIGHWGLLSYLFIQRTGLFLNQIFLLVTQNQLVKFMYPQEERYQMDQTIKILLNSQWKKDEDFVKSISVLLNMPTQKQEMGLQVTNSFKILGFLSQQDQFSLFVKRVIRVLSDYKIIQAKQQKFKIQFSNLINNKSEKQQKDQSILLLKKYVISEPDSFIADQYNVFSEEEISKNYKYDSLDQKKLIYQSKFQEAQSTISFSKNNVKHYYENSETKNKRKIQQQSQNKQNKFFMSIKRPNKNDYNEGMRRRYNQLSQHYSKKIKPCFQKKNEQIFKQKKQKQKLQKIFRKTYIDSTIDHRNKQKKQLPSSNTHIFKINQNHSNLQIQSDSNQLKSYNMLEESQQITMKRNQYQKLSHERKIKNNLKKQKNRSNCKNKKIATNKNYNENHNNNEESDDDSEEFINQQNFQYQNNVESESYQNQETKRFNLIGFSQQEKLKKFNYLKEKQNEKNKINKNLRENSEKDKYFQNIQFMEIKKAQINQLVTPKIQLNSNAYFNYLKCLCSQKQIKKQVQSIVRQYLIFAQSRFAVKRLICFKKILLAYVCSMCDDLPLFNFWKYYGDNYLIPIIKKCIFRHISILLAGQINILFSSEENQNIQLLNQQLADINFIFQQSKIVSTLKVRNQIIINFTKWMYSQCANLFKTISQCKKFQISNEILTNLSFQKNEEYFQRQLKISLKPIDKFTSVIISLLLIDQHLLEISTKNIQGSQISLIYKQKCSFWLKQASEVLKQHIFNETNKKTVLNMLILINKCFQIAVIKNKSKQQTFKLKCKIISHFIDYFKIANQQNIAAINKQFRNFKDNMYNQLIKCLNCIITEFIQGQNKRLNAFNFINIVTKQTQLKEFFDPTFAKIENGDNLDSNKCIQINLAIAIQIYKIFLKFQIFQKIEASEDKAIQKGYFLKNLQKIKKYVLKNQKVNYDSSFLIGLWQLFLEVYKLRINIKIWQINDLFLKSNSQYRQNFKSNIDLWQHIQKLYEFVQTKYVKVSNQPDNIGNDQFQKKKKYAQIIKYYLESIFQFYPRKNNSHLYSLQQRKLFFQHGVNDALVKSIPHYYNLVNILVKTTKFFNDYLKLRRMLNQKENNLKELQNFYENIIIKTIQNLQYLNQLLQIQKEIKFYRESQNQDQLQFQVMTIAFQRKKLNANIMERFLTVVSKHQINFQIKSENINRKYQLQGIIHTIIYLSKSYKQNSDSDNKKLSSYQNKENILTNINKYQGLNLIKFYLKIDNYQQVSYAQIYFTGITIFISKYLTMLSSDKIQKVKAQKYVTKQLFSKQNLNLIGSIMIEEIFLNKPENIGMVSNLFIRIYEFLFKQATQNLNKQWNLTTILYKILKLKPDMSSQDFLTKLYHLSNENLSLLSIASMQILQSLLLMLKQAIYHQKNAQIKSNLAKNLLNSFKTLLIWPQMRSSTIKKYLNQITSGSQQQILMFLKPNFQNIKLIIQTFKAVQSLTENIFQIKQTFPRIIVNSFLKQIYYNKTQTFLKQGIYNFYHQQKYSPKNLFNLLRQIFDYLQKLCEQTDNNTLQIIKKLTLSLCSQFIKPLGLQISSFKVQNNLDKKHQTTWLTKQNFNFNTKYQIIFTYFAIIKDSLFLRKQLQTVFYQNINQIQQIIQRFNSWKGNLQYSSNILKQQDIIESVIHKFLIGQHSDFYLLKALVNSRIQKVKQERDKNVKKKIENQIQGILQKIIKIGRQSLQYKNKGIFLGQINQDLYDWFLEKQTQIKSLNQNKNTSLHNNNFIKENQNNQQKRIGDNQVDRNKKMLEEKMQIQN